MPAAVIEYGPLRGFRGGRGLRGLGQVPGVTYPSPMPPTTAELAAQSIAQLRAKYPDVGREVAKALLSPIKAGGAAKAVKLWSDLAYHALARIGEDAFAAAERIADGMAPPGLPFIRLTRTVRRASVRQGGAKEFFDAWRQSLDVYKRSWDRLHAPKMALRTYLEQQDPERLLTPEEMAEFKRQVAIFAITAKDVEAVMAEAERNLRGILTSREAETSFAQAGRDLQAGFTAAVRGLGTAAGAIVKFTAENVVAPLVGGILGSIPWWLWPVGFYAGGVALRLLPGPGALVERVRARIAA